MEPSRSSTFSPCWQAHSTGHPPDATIIVPGSKSVTNRALLIAALANGTSTIRNTLFSDDSYWLMHALVRLGFAVARQPHDRRD